MYYYTRPLRQFPTEPPPYAAYLLDYRRAHCIHRVVWVPLVVMQLVGIMVHLLALLLGPVLPFLQSIDYLLQVTKNEHSFDLTAVQRDFPELPRLEETIVECFERRHRQLQVRSGDQKSSVEKSL